MQHDFKRLIERAVEIKGSQAKLAADAGCSQQQISYLLNEANAITAEMAIAIDKATEGVIARGALRPDIFQPQGA
jgi:DNA-binding transcriptional regulator YdaS (Cro superfamily)